MEQPAIFSRGSTLADVPPDFRGITLSSWLATDRLKDIAAQCSAHLKTLPKPETLAGDSVLPATLEKTKGREWHSLCVHGSRDNYGWKSI
jgi:hypothetical protein